MGCDYGRMVVHRSRWTDERLDELAERVTRQDVLEVRFDSLERRFDDIESRLEAFQTEMREFRRDVHAELVNVRRDFFDTRRWALALWITGVIALIAMFVEISIRS
jgi:hypothetical protein